MAMSFLPCPAIGNRSAPDLMGLEYAYAAFAEVPHAQLESYSAVAGLSSRNRMASIGISGIAGIPAIRRFHSKHCNSGDRFDFHCASGEDPPGDCGRGGTR